MKKCYPPEWYVEEHDEAYELMFQGNFICSLKRFKDDEPDADSEKRQTAYLMSAALELYNACHEMTSVIELALEHKQMNPNGGDQGLLESSMLHDAYKKMSDAMLKTVMPVEFPV